MRKLALIALFVLLWFIGDRGAAFLIGKMLDHSREPVAQLYGGQAAAGIVLLGNSRALRNFNLSDMRRGFDQSVVNLGVPGASMELCEALLGDYVDRYGPPKTLIIEASAAIGMPDSIKNMRVFMTRSARFAGLMKEHFPELYYAGQVSHLFDYNSHFVLNLAHKVFFPMPELLLDGSLSPASVEAVRPGDYFAPHDREVEALRRIVALAHRANVQIKLILSPAVVQYAAANEIGELRSAIHNAAPELRAWDFIEGPPLDIKYFDDQTHLNRNGVSVFMETLKRCGFYSKTASTCSQGSAANGLGVPGQREARD